MILSDGTLTRMLEQFIPTGSNEKYVNPASIDICIGANMRLETGYKVFRPVDMVRYTQNEPFLLEPGAFALVDTKEVLAVPNGYCVELKLKSSRAREGWNHSLAFWFDPGWYGIGTMEISNVTRFNKLPIWFGMRFAQIIVHRLDTDAVNPYNGRYQNAKSVEFSKG